MLVASDFRARARAALNGKWAPGVGAGFVASLLGAYTAFDSAIIRVEAVQEERLERMLSPEVYAMVADIVPWLVSIAALWGFVMVIFGGPVSLGYAKFNLDLVDGKPTEFTELFSQYHRFGEGFLVRFLRLLYISLWSMAYAIPCVVVGIILAVIIVSMQGVLGYYTAVWAVLICTIPAVVLGVMKTYSYAMAAYIMYENPGITANTAIQRSIDLMKGNRWRLFCLTMSFIGWSLLSTFTLFIGLLWVKPYQEAAFAAFYREIYRERYGEPVKTEQLNDFYGQDSFSQDSFSQGYYSQGNNDFSDYNK